MTDQQTPGTQNVGDVVPASPVYQVRDTLQQQAILVVNGNVIIPKILLDDQFESRRSDNPEIIQLLNIVKNQTKGRCDSVILLTEPLEMGGARVPVVRYAVFEPNAEGLCFSTMCGNGLRAAVDLNKETLQKYGALTLSTDAGVFTATETGQDSFSIQCGTFHSGDTPLLNVLGIKPSIENATAIGSLEQAIRLELLKFDIGLFSATFGYNSDHPDRDGEPHLVLHLEGQLSTEELMQLACSVGQNIMQIITSMGNGTQSNITFVSNSRLDTHGSHCNAVTYERHLAPGPGSVTQACGTGSMAAISVIAKHLNLQYTHGHAHFPGGELLVDIESNSTVIHGTYGY